MAIDAAAMRFLELHETRSHALGTSRQIRDLGDAVLLHDPDDRDPFWNRLGQIRFPADGRAFDRRLMETLALFGAIDRRPHLWTSPVHGMPSDLGHRLVDHGFVDLGGGLVMVHVDPAPIQALAHARPADGVTIERLNRPSDPIGRATAGAELALVLGEAFELDPGRRSGLALDTASALRSEELTAYLVRVDGEPVAAAKRTTFDGASYLSSIGTRPAYRGRGLGALVTAIATSDALTVGSRWTYLGVFSDNGTAQRLYDRLGFAIVGGVAGDYLLP